MKSILIKARQMGINASLLAASKNNMRECKPYCSLLNECLAILAIYPFHTKETDFAATEIKKSIRAIQEKTFEKMYYSIREELSEVMQQRDSALALIRKGV